MIVLGCLHVITAVLLLNLPICAASICALSTLQSIGKQRDGLLRRQFKLILVVIFDLVDGFDFEPAIDIHIAFSPYSVLYLYE